MSSAGTDTGITPMDSLSELSACNTLELAAVEAMRELERGGAGLRHGVGEGHPAFYSKGFFALLTGLVGDLLCNETVGLRCTYLSD